MSAPLRWRLDYLDRELARSIAADHHANILGCARLLRDLAREAVDAVEAPLVQGSAEWLADLNGRLRAAGSRQVITQHPDGTFTATPHEVSAE